MVAVCWGLKNAIVIPLPLPFFFFFLKILFLRITYRVLAKLYCRAQSIAIRMYVYVLKTVSF